MSFPCSIFCPEVPAIYHCVITSAQVRWSVSGTGINGERSYGASDPIGRTLPLLGSPSFIVNKTSNNSFSLNFTANIEFNNSVTVTCVDQADSNSNTDSRQCIFELKGKREKLLLSITILTGPPTTSPSSLSYTAISATSVTISWSPSSEQCLDYYSVTVTNQNTNQQEIINTTSTSLTISNRQEGVQYSYTVTVVDGANRSGPQSNSGCFNLDSMLELVKCI